MKEYCVYWHEDGEPRHEVFSSLPEAEMFSCMIRGREGVEYVEISEEERKPPEMSVNPSIHSSGFLFGNSPVSVGYRLVVTKVGKAFGISKRFAYFCAPAIRMNV